MRISDWSSDVCSSDLYLDAIGARYVGRTPVTAFLRLSESIDLQRVDPAQVRIPTTVVAVEGDWLVPLTDAVALVEGLGTLGKLRLLRSSYGHDALLKETDRIDAIRSEEHTSELQSLTRISYAVFCLKKKKQTHQTTAQPRPQLTHT